MFFEFFLEVVVAEVEGAALIACSTYSLPLMTTLAVHLSLGSEAFGGGLRVVVLLRTPPS